MESKSKEEAKAKGKHYIYFLIKLDSIVRRKFTDFEKEQDSPSKNSISEPERQIVKLKRKIVPTKIENEESTAVEDPKPGQFKLGGQKLPTMEKIAPIKFNFNPNLTKPEFNLKSND